MVTSGALREPLPPKLHPNTKRRQWTSETAYRTSVAGASAVAGGRHWAAAIGRPPLGSRSYIVVCGGAGDKQCSGGEE